MTQQQIGTAGDGNDPMLLPPRERAFYALVEGTTHMVVLVDAAVNVVYASPSVGVLLGYEPEHLRGRNLIDLIHPDDLEAAAEGIEIEVANPGSARLGGDDMNVPHEYRVRRGDGVWIPVEVLANNMLGDPKAAGILIVARDVSDRRLADDIVDLLAHSAPLDRVLGSVADLLEKQIQGLAVAVRVEALADDGIVAVRSDPGPATPLPDVLAGLDVSDGPTPWEQALRTREAVFLADVTAPGTDAAPSVRDAAARLGYRGCWALPVTGADGEDPTGCLVAWSVEPREPLAGYMVALRRATRLSSLAITRSRTEERLRFAATHDPLTGVLNRRAFVERLEDVLRSNPAPVRHAVLFLDLDHFKPVNDGYGHVVGDDVLNVVARRIESALREGDTVSRVGGDEFCVLCADVDRRSAAAVADRIISAIARPIVVDGIEVALGASVGMAIGSAPAETATSLLRRADAALYEVKENGRGDWRMDRSA